MGAKVWGFVKCCAPLLLFALGLASCQSDGEARLQVTMPGQPLAVGAYQRLSYGDGCSGGGKINFCSTERLVTLDELTSESPEIAAVVLAADAPAAGTGATHYVFGVAPGKATLHFRGTFDDGSVRSADLVIEVRKADRVAISMTCNGTDAKQVVTMPGGDAFFRVELLHQATKLAGFHPDAVVPMSGLTRQLTADSENRFTWTAPAEPSVVDVLSGLVPAPIGTLRAYGPSDVTDMVVDSPNGSSLATWASGSTRIDATTTVVGTEPCEVAPVVFRTETPEVCSGPEDALSRPGEDRFGGFVEMKGEGVCRVSASPDGVRFFGPASLRFFVVQEPGTEKFDGFNQPCAVEGSTSCTYGDNSQVTVCRDGRWAAKETCGPTRTCDARDASLSGCVAGGPCSECRAMR